MRNRTGPQRTRFNADENSTSKHLRQTSSIAAATASRSTHSLVNVHALKNGPHRSALGEVTTTAVNRKVRFSSITDSLYRLFRFLSSLLENYHLITSCIVQENANKFSGKDKDAAEAGVKRLRSSSTATATGPQRIPLGPGRGTVHVPSVNTRTSTTASRLRAPHVPARATHRVPVPQEPVITHEVVGQEEDEESFEMDIEQAEEDLVEVSVEDQSLVNQREVENMVDVDSEDEVEAEEELMYERPVRYWPEVSTARATRFRKEIDDIKEIFQDEIDEEDTTMVSEYANEIFEYMNEIEVSCLVV